MRTIPILFSTQMVQALLDGRKTQTRRVVKEAQGWDPVWKPTLISETHMDGIPHYEMRTGTQYSLPWFKCPYGQPGDVLWVRESYNVISHLNPKRTIYEYYYKADAGNEFQRMKPSIHMPKEACRLFMKVKSVRIERLQDISEQDAMAEGVETLGLYPGYQVSPRGKFEGLWNLINGPESWDANPWVWVVAFERTEKPANWPN